jgi:hypothetical protein
MSEKRIRSPNYPAISLPAAIERISALYKNQNRHAAPREVVANSLGFRSLSGPAATVISTLFKYGLLERVGTEAKISERALQILFPNSREERESAIRVAANEPQLFAELNERFPGGGSDALLRNYLTRRNFSPSALDDVILAFKETAEFALQEAPSNDSPVPREERTMLGERQRDQESQGQRREPSRLASEMDHLMGPIGSGPLSQRLKVMNTGTHLRVTADLLSSREVEKLIQILEANKDIIGNGAEAETACKGEAEEPDLA